VRPRAGSVGFPRLTVPGVSIDEWAAGLVEAEGVLLLPVRSSGMAATISDSASGGPTCQTALERLERLRGAHAPLGPTRGACAERDRSGGRS
jgi:hypothetical protein